MIIAIDGLAGSGKTSTAKLLSKKLDYNCLDTGSMYRALTYFILKHKIKLDEVKIIDNFIADLSFDISYNKDEMFLFCNGENVTKYIRNDKVSDNVSYISSLVGCRERMVSIQRDIVGNNNFVVEGRDIGTVVFPKADYKFFLTAEINTRSSRRLNQFETQSNIDEIKNNIINRDNDDSSRNVSPLKMADDAVLIDTTNITLEQQVNMIISYIK